MKKFVQIMAVALVAVMALGVLVACGYSDDPDKAAEQLEKKGYEMHVSKNPSGDADVVAVVMASKSNFDLEDIFEVDVEDIVIEFVVITYFKSADLAKEGMEAAEENLDSDAQGVKVSRQGSKIVVTYKLTGADAL